MYEKLNLRKWITQIFPIVVVFVKYRKNPILILPLHSNYSLQRPVDRRKRRTAYFPPPTTVFLGFSPRPKPHGWPLPSPSIQNMIDRTSQSLPLTYRVFGS
ncbi:hypothetical protein L1887_29704 [Cichorium endivia]|nr:hypothetical protein L1887_29704 [Cichorium endivia]